MQLPRKLKAYRKVYTDVSPSKTPKDNLTTSNLDQFEACLSGEAPKVQSTILEDMKGGAAIEETLGD
jgi:hypothetical protein